MEREWTTSSMEITIKENTRMENLRDLVCIHGQMEVSIQATSKGDSSLERESGGKPLSKLVLQQMNTMVSICKIRSADTVSSNGLQAIHTRVITKMMKEMDMGRCVGLMVASMLVSGCVESSMVMVR